MPARAVKVGRFTPSAADLTRFLSNATGATWTLTNNSTGDGMGHYVTIRNDSATNHSAKTAVLTGYDASGRAITETVNLPAGSATVTSTKAFSYLTSVVPSATIGADTMDIGISAAAVTLDFSISGSRARVDLVLVSGSINYDFEHSLSDAPDELSFIGDLTGQTVSKSCEYATPVVRGRISMNSGSSPVFEVYRSVSED